MLGILLCILLCFVLGFSKLSEMYSPSLKTAFRHWQSLAFIGRVNATPFRVAMAVIKDVGEYCYK